MQYVDHQTDQLTGLTLHTVQTKKYKTNSIVLQILRPLEGENVTKRALLPYVLQAGTNRYPSSKDLRGALDDMYGASLSVDLSKKGENQVISIRMEVANEKFLSDNTPLFEQSLNLLSEILLQPAAENGSFNEEIVNKEKRSLKQQIESIYDDKMRYANKRLLEEMYKNEPYRYNVYGEESEVDRISAKDLYTYYKGVIAQDRIDLYVIGDIEELNVKEAAEKFFTLENRGSNNIASKKDQVKPEQVNEVFEEQDVQQGKLNMGYRTYTTYSDRDYYALQVCNGVFGGFSHSKLFMNVREKESLAYYAVSRFESHKGAIFVMSGIETGNYEKAVKIIKEQLDEIVNGNITDSEFEQTKAMIKNQILETIDSSFGLTEVLYHAVVSGTDRSVEEWLNGIDAVSKQDVIDVAKKLALDTIYFLKGGSNDAE
ncbi:EF-P 5-aminopentanol modification-associated protein YfmF [Fictibacillus aquaticus]|uniref:Peptidase M16 n=1 Tax=Fictibacillus aquaticus TaxID=2021314 RepID=A0A235FBU3_9BACL|nr:pitrilysin family protein [Fictibacillus aquaticus]OYD58796.1 peptidase M16 [Fictibacillus aquaticus]